MFYIVESSKSFYEACFDLEPIAQRLGFEVLQTHNWGDLLSRKGGGIDDEFRMFEIFSHRYVEQLLGIDIRLGLILPWRVSVYTENGATKIALLRPQAMAGVRSAQVRIIHEIEQKMVLLVDEVR